MRVYLFLLSKMVLDYTCSSAIFFTQQYIFPCQCAWVFLVPQTYQTLLTFGPSYNPGIFFPKLGKSSSLFPFIFCMSVISFKGFFLINIQSSPHHDSPFSTQYLFPLCPVLQFLIVCFFTCFLAYFFSLNCDLHKSRDQICFVHCCIFSARHIRSSQQISGGRTNKLVSNALKRSVFDLSLPVHGGWSILFFSSGFYLLLVKKQYSTCRDLYLGFILIRYGKVTDIGIAAFERRVYYIQFPRERDMPLHAGLHGEVPGSVKSRSARERMVQSLYCGNCRKKWEKQCRKV